MLLTNEVVQQPRGVILEALLWVHTFILSSSTMGRKSGFRNKCHSVYGRTKQFDRQISSNISGDYVRSDWSGIC